MTLEEIENAIHKILSELLDLTAVYVPQYRSIEIIDGRVSRSDIEGLKAVARELLRLFNAASELKRHAMKLSENNWIATVQKEVDGLPESAKKVKDNGRIALKDCMKVHTEADNAMVQLCIDAMRGCKEMLDLLRGVFEQIKNLEQV